MGSPGWARLVPKAIEYSASSGDARQVEVSELLFLVVQLRDLQFDVALQNSYVPVQLLLLLQQLLLLLVVVQLDLLHLLLVLADQARAILAAQVVVPGQPHVLGRENTDVTLVHGHSVAQSVQVGLEFRDHLFGKVGAVGADLLQIFLLLRAGEVERRQAVEERVDFGEEGFGDVRDSAQRVDELLFALDLVELDGLLVHKLFPPELNGLEVEVVTISGDQVNLHLHPHGSVSEVLLEQVHLCSECFHLQSAVTTTTKGGLVHREADISRTVHRAAHQLKFALFQLPVVVFQEHVGDVGDAPLLPQVVLEARPLCGGHVEQVCQVLPLRPQAHRLHGELAEAELQVLCAGHRGGVLLLAVDQEEHQADDDERLDQGGEEEHDPHVVAAALALARTVGHPLAGLRAVLGNRGVHGWPTKDKNTRC